jgi:hypothetical protein
MLSRVLLLCLLVLVVSSPGSTAYAQCGNNACTTIVLHAMPSFGGCAGTGGMDCRSVLPTTDLSAAGIDAPAIYVFLRNYDFVTGMQCAFDWPASWVFVFGLWSCQSNQVNGVTPSAPGQTTGTIATAFDAISGGSIALIGGLSFGAAPDGCLQIIESSFPFGTHVVNTEGDPPETPVPEFLRGSVCATQPGYDACDPSPVDPVSWGRIKQTYR